MERQSHEVEGIRMQWLESGQGAAVVFLHGLPTGPELWRHVMPRVTSARCLAFEMVGYGASIPQGLARDISVARQADYLLAWLRMLNIDRALLVGHDLGGGVAQIAAVRDPGRCAGLVLTNSIGYDSWPILGVKALQAAGSVIEHLPQGAFKPIIRGMIRLGHDERKRARESFHIHWRHYAEHDGPRAFVRQINALDVRDTLDVVLELPRLDVPARVVWGAADPFHKVYYGQRLANDLNTNLDRIEKGRHFTPEDHPDAIAAAVTDLLPEAFIRQPRREPESIAPKPAPK